MSQISQIYLSDSNEEFSPFISTCIQTIKESYSDTSYVLYNKESLRTFIENEFDSSTLKAYDKIKPSAYKADLGRYCILYKYGGWYFDIAVRCVNAISVPDEIETIAFRDMQIYTQTSWACQNSVLYSKASNPIYQKAIEIVLENVKNNYYGINAICPTGPAVLGRAFAINAESKNRIFGDFVFLTPNLKLRNPAFVLPDGSIFALAKPASGGDLISLGLKGTNNYNDFYNSKNVYEV